MTGWAAAGAVACLLASTICEAAEQAWLPGPHFLAGASLGGCGREDPNVQGGGWCGELAVAGDLPLGFGLRTGLELGIGFMDSTSSGDRRVGVERSSGKPGYGAVRLLLGYDFSDRFFGRLGLQGRATSALGRFNPGLQITHDLGTRVFQLFEIGLRAYVGIDRIATTGSPNWGTALCFGTLFQVRFKIK